MGEPRSDVDHQRRLVVLDCEDIIAAGRDDRRAEVPLAEQGIAGDDVALHRQDVQQLQGCLVLVGLGIDLDLAQNRLGFGEVGGDEMLAGHFTLPAAARGLAVQGDQFLLAFGQAGGDPAGQGLLEGVHVQDPEEHGEGGLGGCLAAREAEGVRQGETMVPAVLGNGLVAFGARQHGHDSEGKDGGERMASPMA